MGNIKIYDQNTIASCIYFVRGEKVMLDSDLAILYGVETKILNKAVKRNITRFPDDFMFQLTKEEYNTLRFQFGTSKMKNTDNQNSDNTLRFQNGTSNKGGRRYLPYTFTEQGVAMLSGILSSERAVSVNVAIMRTFVNLRKILLYSDELSRKLNELEDITKDKFKKQDEQIQLIFEAIKQLIQQNNEPREAIGYKISKSIIQNKK